MPQRLLARKVLHEPGGSETVLAAATVALSDATATDPLAASFPPQERHALGAHGLAFPRPGRAHRRTRGSDHRSPHSSPEESMNPKLKQRLGKIPQKPCDWDKPKKTEKAAAADKPAAAAAAAPPLPPPNDVECYYDSLRSSYW